MRTLNISKSHKIAGNEVHYLLGKFRDNFLNVRETLRAGSTGLKITWVQQMQHNRAQKSARERMLSLPLIVNFHSLCPTAVTFDSVSHHIRDSARF